MFAATRSRRGGLALLVALLCASAAAPASGAVPGDYTVSTRYDGGPLPGGGLGAQLANIGDVDGDGKNDLAIGNPAADGSRGEVVVLSGSSGTVIWRAAAPGGAAESSDDGQPLMFGSRVAPLGDVASCGTPDQQSAGTDCGRRAIADGVPELLVTALGGDSGPSGVDQGRVYVLDGRTGAIHRRLRVGNADLPSGGQAEFGYAIGSAGDVDGDGEPEAAVGAPGYTETFDTAPTACEDAPGSGIGTCEGAGRVYLFPSAQLGGPAPSGDPSSEFTTDNATTPPLPVQNPDAQAEVAGSTSEERFGAAVSAIGSAGELLIGAPQTDLAGASGTGAVYLMDGVTGNNVRAIESPGLQPGARFGEALWAGASSHAIVGAPGIGSAYRIDVGTGLPSNPFIDPDPTLTGFGSSITRLPDDMAGIGSPSRSPSGAVRIFSADGTLAQTVCDPDGQAGASFGASVASLGDANGDGFDELAIGAPGFDHPAGGDSGRVYVLTSKGGGAPDPNACVPSAPGGSGSGGGSSGGGSTGSTAATPPKSGTVVIARVLRRLVLKPSRKRVRENRRFRLRGRLTASANRSVCQRRQKIALQRRLKGGRYQTFEVAVTRASGAFTARTLASRTYAYRARVSQTSRCMGAVSRTAKVRVLRKRGRR